MGNPNMILEVVNNALILAKYQELLSTIRFGIGMIIVLGFFFGLFFLVLMTKR